MKALFLISLLLISEVLFSQETEQNYEKRTLNHINFNVGEGSLASLNYERLFHVKPNLFLAGQFGIGSNEDYNSETGETTTRYVVLPHHLTGNIGGKRSYLEFGLTGLYISGDVEHSYIPGALLGYRHQPLKTKRVGFRAYFNVPFYVFSVNPFYPELEYERAFMYVPFGFSVGYNF